MKYFLYKLPMRKASLFELACLYFVCFSFAGSLLYLQRLAENDYFLKDHMAPILGNQTKILLCFSVIVVMFHYQFVVNSKTEVRCRIMVGDLLWRIRNRYIAQCVVALACCFACAVAIHAALGFQIIHCIQLTGALIAYILASSICIGIHRN